MTDLGPGKGPAPLSTDHTLLQPPTIPKNKYKYQLNTYIRELGQGPVFGPWQGSCSSPCDTNPSSVTYNNPRNTYQLNVYIRELILIMNHDSDN